MGWLRRAARAHPEDAVRTEHPTAEKTVADEIRDIERINAVAEQAATVRGRHFTAWLPELDRLRREKRDDEALVLLEECMIASAAETSVQGWQTPPPAYAERMAVIYRRQKRYRDEVDVLERYLSLCGEAAEMADVSARLVKARSLAAAVGNAS